MWKRLLFVLFVLFCLEVGLFLIILPWLELWERNILFAVLPDLKAALLNNYVRGAISGLGFINLWVGLSDAWHFRRNLASLDAVEPGAPAAGGLDADAAGAPSRHRGA